MMLLTREELSLCEMKKQLLQRKKKSKYGERKSQQKNNSKKKDVSLGLRSRQSVVVWRHLMKYDLDSKDKNNGFSKNSTG